MCKIPKTFQHDDLSGYLAKQMYVYSKEYWHGGYKWFGTASAHLP
jgi:hypothetical protein